MNSEDAPSENTRAVMVFFNPAEVPGLLRKGEPALVRPDSMTLMEDVTEFLRVWFVESGRRSSERTWANAAQALATWIDFLDAIGIDDWKDASRDDLLEYRESYLAAISPKTGQPYARGTVAGRMSTICALYAFAGRRGWYRGDILDEQSPPRRVTSPLDRDALAHTRNTYLHSVEIFGQREGINFRAALGLD